MSANYPEIPRDFVETSLRARGGKLADAALFASEGEIREADVSRNLISCTCDVHELPTSCSVAQVYACVRTRIGRSRADRPRVESNCSWRRFLIYLPVHLALLLSATVW